MSEKYLGEVSTPLLINQIKENCAQKRSTLPIPSVDELGNTYQYTGTTSGSLVHGYFYECVSDGQDPATYSWAQVNTQPTPATPTASGTTFDNTTSGLQATNVQGAIDEVVDGLGTAASKDFTPNVAPNNHNLVESNAVYNAITTALTSIYTPRGDLTCAELTSSLLIAANVGNIYEMSDTGTTSALFLQGAGQTIHVGDNVGIIQTGVDTYKFNLMANAFDMTDYQKKDLTQAVEGATTVESALSALSTNKQAKTLSTSVESQTTVEGALSALSANKQDSLTFDNAPTENSNNPVKSSGIYSANQNIYEVIGENGAKNLLPIKYSKVTNYGLTWEKLDDGSVIMNGTSTASPAQQSLFDATPATISSTGSGTTISLKELGIDGTKKYIFSRDTKITNVRPRIDLWSDSAKLLEVELSNNDGLYKEIDFSQYPTCIGIKATIQVTLNTTVTNAIQKLMLCSKEWYDGNPTYESYSKTNQQLTAKTDGLWDNTMNNGAVNLLENVGTTTTVNGITFTVNSDGTVTVSGTATANVALPLKMRPYLGNSFPLKLSGCPVGGSFSSGYRLQYANYVDMTDLVSDEGDGAIITKQIDYTTYPNARISIEIRNGTQISTPIVFKPMVSDASLNLSYDDYVPYAKTNKELTDVIPSDASILNKLVAESGFKSYGIKTIWQGSKTKGATNMNFDASPYDLCFAQVGGTLCMLISGMGGGTTTRKKFTTVYAGRDNTTNLPYQQYYLFDILGDGTVATCGWFDLSSLNIQNARLAGKKALELALAGTSTWTDPTWKYLSDVETNVNVSKIIGIKFQSKS